MGEMNIDGHQVPFIMRCMQCDKVLSNPDDMKKHFKTKHSELFEKKED